MQKGTILPSHDDRFAHFTNQDPPGIDLGLGDPPFSLLPLGLLQRAAEIRFIENDPAFLQYGAEQGDGRFRLALADFLSRGYEIPVEAGSLFVTNGVSNALDLICTPLHPGEDVIFVEGRPTSWPCASSPTTSCGRFHRHRRGWSRAGPGRN
jgi:DNA-binding transcriptional MocR family regulator